jgi:TIR domain
VAVLSAAYLRSAHGEAEWRVFYAQDPSGKQGLLMPVRVDNVDPPGLLKTRVYVDLVDQAAAGARALLLAAARGARGSQPRSPSTPAISMAHLPTRSHADSDLDDEETQRAPSGRHLVVSAFTGERATKIATATRQLRVTWSLSRPYVEAISSAAHWITADPAAHRVSFAPSSR